MTGEGEAGGKGKSTLPDTVAAERSFPLLFYLRTLWQGPAWMTMRGVKDGGQGEQ